MPKKPNSVPEESILSLDDLGEQLLADAALSGAGPPSDAEFLAVLDQMERSASW